MQLKDYQRQTLEQLDRWIVALGKAKRDTEMVRRALGGRGLGDSANPEGYPSTAWSLLKSDGVLPRMETGSTSVIPGYVARTAASGAPIPHACLKIPTGGGKTLLGVAALDRLQLDTGLVLWLVPTRAIYEQTVTAFRTKEHPYRQMLDRTSRGRLKLLEKVDLFTRQDISSHLCVLTLMLPSANRQKGRDFLKIFRDSGYSSFFPDQDDVEASHHLVSKHPDLTTDMNGKWIRHSLVNALKLFRPTVILDEAHKAYGSNDTANREFVRSISNLNPRVVLELSATPKIGISNILVNVSGQKLKNEEMIKLPVEIHHFANSDWKHTLARAQACLNRLHHECEVLNESTARYVRPIAVVRVQRTGRDQRTPDVIHADDVRNYLRQGLGVSADQVRIQSSEKKELAGENLLSELSPVRWIITKDALKEGWDCSFAYVLVLLDNTRAPTAMTQMVGRVMRQPQAREIASHPDLNRCYVYCYNQDVGEAVESVKKGLEREGLTGLRDAVHHFDGSQDMEHTTIRRRKPYRRLKIFLPQVLHRRGGQFLPIDYDRDILRHLPWHAVDGGNAVNLNDESTKIESRVAIDILGQSEIFGAQFDDNSELTIEYFIRRLTDLIPNPWQAARIADNFLTRHQEAFSESVLLENRIYLSEVLCRRVQASVERAAETLFREKLGRNEIRFRLETDKHLNFSLATSLETSIREMGQKFSHKSGKPVEKSLFEPVFRSEFNELEADFALYLDKTDSIKWWHRIASRQAYFLQGWRRHRVYPDFVACRTKDGKLLFLETKGLHLKRNDDTEYKRKLLETLEEASRTAVERGVMKVKEPPVSLRMMFEDAWRETLNEALSEEE